MNRASLFRGSPLLLLAVALAVFIVFDPPPSVQAQESTNANLGGLTASGSDSATGTFTAFDLSPAFSASTTSYSATVANTVTHIKLRPTVEDTGKATVWAGRSGSLKSVTDGTDSDAYGLVEGANSFLVRVWAEDQNEIMDYWLTISRTPANRSIVSPVSVIVREGGPKQTVTATLSEVVTRESNVRITWTHNNLWANVHVDAILGNYPITVARGQNTFQFEVTPIDDSLREGSQTYPLIIQIDTDADGSYDDVTGSIDVVVEDNEDTPVFRLEASSTTVTEGDSVRVRVIDYPDSTAVKSTGKAKLGTHKNPRQSGFVEGADFFMDPSQTTTICPNVDCSPLQINHWGLPDAQGWITVGTVPDGVREGEETIVLTAFNVQDPDQKTEPVTIRLRDLVPVNLSLSASSRDLRKNGGPVTVSVSLNRPAPENTRIRISPSGSASVLPLGESLANYDYEMVPSQKVVTNNQARETQVESFIGIDKGETQGKSEITLTALRDATPGQTITLTARSVEYPNRFKSGSTTIRIGDPIPEAPNLIGLTASSISPTGRFPALPLTPSTFSSSVTDYTAAVANTVTRAKVTPTVDPRYKWTATIEVGPQGGRLRAVDSGRASHTIPLVEGANPITVRVTRMDGRNSKDYTVTITRAATANSPPLTGSSPEQGGNCDGCGTEGELGTVTRDQSPQEQERQQGDSSEKEGVVPREQSPQQPQQDQDQQGGGSEPQLGGSCDDCGPGSDLGGIVLGQSPQQQVPPNRAPTVSSPMPDVAGLAEGATREVSLSGVFSDADGDALSITASSDDETIVRVAVASDFSKLILSGVSSGEATITVVAQDPDGNSATDDFSVEVTDSQPPPEQQQQQQQVPATSTTTPDPEPTSTPEPEEAETEAGGPDAAELYDADGDGSISQSELRQALDDYYAAKITYAEMLAIYKAYRAS